MVEVVVELDEVHLDGAGALRGSRKAFGTKVGILLLARDRDANGGVALSGKEETHRWH
jgi:hypothetical protein